MTEPKPPQNLSGLEIALQWAQLPADHLKVALEALEPELARQHEMRVLEAQLAVQAEEQRRNHLLYLCGLVGGFFIVVAMLGGAVAVGIEGLPWLSAMLAGPSVLSLAGLFVLRRIDSDATRHTARAHDAALSAASQPGGSSVV